MGMQLLRRESSLILADSVSDAYVVKRRAVALNADYFGDGIKLHYVLTGAGAFVTLTCQIIFLLISPRNSLAPLKTLSVEFLSREVKLQYLLT